MPFDAHGASPTIRPSTEDGAQSSGYKATPRALEFSHRPAATWWPSTAHPSQEREPREEEGREREEEEGAPDVAGVAVAEGDATVLVMVEGRHGTAFGATRLQLVTALLSPLPQHPR